MPEDTDGPDQPMLTAAKLLAWRHGTAGEVPQLPQAAVLTHQRFLLPRRMPWRRNPSLPGFSFDAHRLAGGAVILAGVRGVGAPATAIAVEELAASGVRRIIAVDVAGGIDATLPSGSTVLIESAIACDGTSPHYAGEQIIQAHEDLTVHLRERLANDGLTFVSGMVFSTDAVYRETPSMLERARRQGASLIDMETAAVFAVATSLGIEAAAVLVAADSVHDAWQPPENMSAIRVELRRLLQSATACLQS